MKTMIDWTNILFSYRIPEEHNWVFETFKCPTERIPRRELRSFETHDKVSGHCDV